MKKLCLLITVCLFIISCSKEDRMEIKNNNQDVNTSDGDNNEQPKLPGYPCNVKLDPNENILLKKQSQVDSIGNLNLKEIHKNLLIGCIDYDSDIHDLSKLKSIERINGSLSIRNCDRLKNIDGISQITYLENLSITHCDSITKLSFINLNETKSSIFFQYNNQVKIIDFSNLNTAHNSFGSGITIKNHNELETFKIKNRTFLEFGLSIYNNPKLTNIIGLSNVKTVEGLLDFTNLAIKDLSFISSLENSSAFFISDNFKLESLRGLENLKNTNGLFAIKNCPLVLDVEPLSNLEKVNGTLIIGNSTTAIDLSALNNVDALSLELTGSLEIHTSGLFNNNPSLTTLTILDNDIISDLSFLSNTTNLTNLTLENNKNLENLSGIPLILHDQIKTVVLKNNENLSDIDQVNNFSTLEELRIIKLSALKKISLNNTISSFRFLHIENNSLLEIFSGHENVTSSNHFIYFGKNPKLKAILGFNKLTDADNILIEENDNLEIVTCFKSILTADYIKFYNNPKFKNFCSINTLNVGTYDLGFEANGNAYNPRGIDLKNGNCTID
ncbi:hypothetical protein [Wenyingzhuangia sp. IMCC45574]